MTLFPFGSNKTIFSGRRTLPRSFMPQENLFQLVPSSRTRSYNGDSTLQYGDLRSMGRTADKSCQRGSAKCKRNCFNCCCIRLDLTRVSSQLMQTPRETTRMKTKARFHSSVVVIPLCVSCVKLSGR